MDHRSAELDRLDRILSAVLDQRSTHEHDRRQPVEQPQSRPWYRRHRCRSTPSAIPRANAEAACSPGCGDHAHDIACAAVGMPRHDHGQQARERIPPASCVLSVRISSSPGWVEAATTIGRPRVTDISRSSLAAIGRRRGHVELQVSGVDRDVTTAKRRETAPPSSCGLRQADVEPAEQRGDGRRRPGASAGTNDATSAR